MKNLKSKPKSKFKLILLITLVTIVLGIGIGVFWSIFGYEKFDLDVYKAKINHRAMQGGKVEQLEKINNAYDARVQRVILWNKRFKKSNPETVNFFEDLLWTQPSVIKVYYDKKNSAWLVVRNSSYTDQLDGVIFNEQGTVLYSWLVFM